MFQSSSTPTSRLQASKGRILLSIGTLVPRRRCRRLGTRYSGAVFIHDSLKCWPNRRMPFGVFSAFSFSSVLLSSSNTHSLACTTLNATYSVLSGASRLARLVLLVLSRCQHPPVPAEPTSSTPLFSFRGKPKRSPGFVYCQAQRCRPSRRYRTMKYRGFPFHEGLRI
jgi:hypothetical protein